MVITLVEDVLTLTEVDSRNTNIVSVALHFLVFARLDKGRLVRQHCHFIKQLLVIQFFFMALAVGSPFCTVSFFTYHIAAFFRRLALLGRKQRSIIENFYLPVQCCV